LQAPSHLARHVGKPGRAGRGAPAQAAGTRERLAPGGWEGL